MSLFLHLQKPGFLMITVEMISVNICSCMIACFSLKASTVGICFPESILLCFSEVKLVYMSISIFQRYTVDYIKTKSLF